MADFRADHVGDWYVARPEQLTLQDDAVQRELETLRAAVQDYRNAMKQACLVLTQARQRTGYPVEVTYLRAMVGAANALGDALHKHEGGAA